jgi:hypothetical protein
MAAVPSVLSVPCMPYCTLYTLRALYVLCSIRTYHIPSPMTLFETGAVQVQGAA